MIILYHANDNWYMDIEGVSVPLSGPSRRLFPHTGGKDEGSWNHWQ